MRMSPWLLSISVALPALALAACGQASAPSGNVAEPVAPASAPSEDAAAAVPAAHGGEAHTGDHGSEHAAAPASADGAVCTGFGPQTPRDIANVIGTNTDAFKLAPASTELNLCNIHTHTNAEHKAPGFSVFAGEGVNGGYKCNETASLTAEELVDPTDGEGAFEGVKPGDTIEVHWVHTSCDITPGKGLGACLSDSCSDPVLRVEAQAFLLVNDPEALDFKDFAYAGNVVDGRHQPLSLPTGTGEPVVFRGSTTGPSYNDATCSPLKVTWSVRPSCAKLNIATLHEWAAKGNVFEETESHGVRPLVTAPELLAPIQ